MLNDCKERNNKLTSYRVAISSWAEMQIHYRNARLTYLLQGKIKGNDLASDSHQQAAINFFLSMITYQ